MDDLGAVDILLVEDSDPDAEMTARALRRGGLVKKLVRVRDGVEALDFVFRAGPWSTRGATQPKVILLDLKMPRLGGIDVLRRLKSDQRTQALPVVMLTSSAEEQDIAESYHLGVNSYLVKPVAFAAFAELVAEVGTYWAVMNRPPV